MSAVPPPPPPVRKFVPRSTPAANTTAALTTTPKPAASATTTTTISPAMKKKLDDLIKGSAPTIATSTANMRPQHQLQQQQAPPLEPTPTAPSVIPQFDKEDIDALRKENKLLQTRLAAFLEFQTSTSQQQNQDAPLNTKGMSEQEVSALMTLMRSRIRQLELALAWECSRREEAEERCFALMKRSVQTSN